MDGPQHNGLHRIPNKSKGVPKKPPYSLDLTLLILLTSWNPYRNVGSHSVTSVPPERPSNTAHQLTLARTQGRSTSESPPPNHYPLIYKYANSRLEIPTSQTLIKPYFCLVFGIHRQRSWYRFSGWFSVTTAVHPPFKAFLLPRATLYERSIDSKWLKKRRGSKWSR